MWRAHGHGGTDKRNPSGYSSAMRVSPLDVNRPRGLLPECNGLLSIAKYGVNNVRSAGIDLQTPALGKDELAPSFRTARAGLKPGATQKAQYPFG
jgi:hypothetical protein